MVTFASHTHPGRVYDHNEDAIGIDAARQRWLIADGMGGHASGEVASAIVRDTVLGATDSALTYAVLAAHRAVAAAASDERLHGMGSTVVAFELTEQGGEVVWVGDSRAYLWRRGLLRLLSRDHSFVELLRDSAGMTEAQIRAHPQRNLVTQTLGIGEAVPSSVSVDLRPNDWLVLCSDGLNDELEDDEIRTQLQKDADPDIAVHHLVNAALAKGGRDNVSVVIVAITRDDLPNRWRQLQASVWLPMLVGVVGAVALGSLVLFWLK